MLAAMPQRLLLPIRFTLFDGSSTSTNDITHYIQTTLTFANGQQQDLWLLMIHLHASAPLILGLFWLHSTNPCVNWWNLTLHFDRQTLKCLEPSPLMLPPQPMPPTISTLLRSSFQIPTALINSGATGMFVSDQLNFTYNSLDKVIELQLFDALEDHPHCIRTTLATDVNSDINWRDFTMKFSEPSACLATVHLCLQSTNDSSEARATGALTAPPDNAGNPPPPQHVLGAPPAFPPNIPYNKYKDPNYSARHP
ncbi:hypothetical protein C0993_010506 [Termitomyces sp. T159_Od127]|nr:hypothetical protein C0993_010506 [Termitomyces sp. T159_Od127]